MSSKRGVWLGPRAFPAEPDYFDRPPRGCRVAVVVRMLLLRTVQLLHPASAARRDGGAGRSGEPPVAVLGDLCGDAPCGTGIWLRCGAALAPAAGAVDVPLFHRQRARLLHAIR